MKYRVIIADDEAKIIHLIEELGRWEELGIEVVDTCRTGSAAYESILQNRPDFVLSDIKMPGLDGLELIKKVRDAGAAPLFILISGYRHFEYARTAVSLNVMDYLLKPIDEEQLNETLARVCRRIDQPRSQQADAEEASRVRQTREKEQIDRFFAEQIFGDSALNSRYLFSERTCNERYGTRFRPGCYRVLYVFSNLSEIMGGNSSVSSEKMEKCMKESFPEYILTYSMSTYKGTVIVLNYSEERRKEVRQTIDAFYYSVRNLREVFGKFRLHIGISAVHASIQELCEAAEEAHAAEWGRLAIGEDGILEYAQIAKLPELSGEMVISAGERREIVESMEGMEALRDYALEVFAGDILYIQGAPGSGVRTLVSLLAGECTLQAGRLYLDGTEISVLNRLAFWRHGLYTITAEKDLVEEMTVAENLEAACYLPNCLKIYRHEVSKRRVAAFLRRQKVDVPSGAFIWSLRRGDRAKLSLIKARMHGAKLIVLDATEDFYEGQEAQELCEIIRRENREGVTFVILSECYSAFAAIATRIQLVDRGRDMKEWPGLTPHIEEVLRGFTPRKRDKAQPDEGRPFLGIYDFAWERRGNFWAYLRQLRDENPEIWKSCLHFEIPEDGTSRRGDTVVIPAGSEDMLLRNLSLSDNLILPCAARVAANRFGRIPRHVQRSMDARFHRLFDLPEDVNRIDQLDRVARKILSIYRYELLRPSTIVLESPYAGMMNSEVLRMRRYLRGLAERGIRVLYFSRSPDTFMADCAAVIVARNGREAKISTE